MTDEAERLLGILDARTQGILTAVTDIKGNINALFERSDKQQSRLDILQAEHSNRIKQGQDCNQTVNTLQFSKLMMALVSGGSSIVGGGIVLIILLLLKKWGIL